MLFQDSKKSILLHYLHLKTRVNFSHVNEVFHILFHVYEVFHFLTQK